MESIPANRPMEPQQQILQFPTPDPNGDASSQKKPRKSSSKSSEPGESPGSKKSSSLPHSIAESSEQTTGEMTPEMPGKYHLIVLPPDDSPILETCETLQEAADRLKELLQPAIVLDQLDLYWVCIVRGQPVEILGDPARIFYLKDGEQITLPAECDPESLQPLPLGRLVDAEDETLDSDSNPDAFADPDDDLAWNDESVF